MRIYKIINSGLIDNAKCFLEEYNTLKEEKLETIKKIVPFEWSSFYRSGSTFNLLPDYISFKPITPLDEVPKGWIEDKEAPGYFKPNRRTKIGKDFIRIQNEIKSLRFDEPDSFLNIEFDYFGRFTPPMIYDSWDKEEFYYGCDSRIKLNKEDFEEVTISYVEERINKPK